ncbi:hypothetical protein [Streptomyces sp. MZ04]|uniref:hypothetical protein n=1 Tax=Streptomyces sp. MZ04 TaxID=2559236 RepID=UPI00107E9C23|nr:hypothetical protein [Streptomyces sp. MZ04]TGB13823.1 hypothetical protein E2651_07720 [Streptomyces sp. MZ04]
MATTSTTQNSTFVGCLVSGFDYRDVPVVGRVTGISRNLNNSIMFIEVEQPGRERPAQLWPERDDWEVC